MRVENPMRLVRELKGAPLSIYIILGLVGQPVTQEYLERATGYTDKPVSQGLAYLAEIGLVVKGRQGWVLANGAVQLPLPMETLEETPPPAPPLQAGRGEDDDLPLPDDNQSAAIQLSRNNSDSVPLINNNNINLLKDEELLLINPEGRKNSDSVKALRTALEELGVSEPKLSVLARGLSTSSRITADEVRALEGELRRKTGAKYSVGLLIYALGRGQRPTPGTLPNGVTRRYDEGEFAEFIDN